MSFKFNPFTGQLDYFEEQQSIDAAKRLQDTRTCAENISALSMVRALNDTEIVLAENDNYINSKALGIALQTGIAGSDIEILLFGKIEDAFFTFTLNEPLFLSLNGVITQTSPTTNYSVNIGHSLGTGAIFIDIKEPIEL